MQESVNMNNYKLNICLLYLAKILSLLVCVAVVQAEPSSYPAQPDKNSLSVPSGECTISSFKSDDPAVAGSFYPISFSWVEQNSNILIISSWLGEEPISSSINYNTENSPFPLKSFSFARKNFTYNFTSSNLYSETGLNWNVSISNEKYKITATAVCTQIIR
ncbi:MAG: hypothetical protein K0R94_1156 [Burkholderiales bacterium]|nr:hypothetical protein [Burkholderiales bacterium]